MASVLSNGESKIKGFKMTDNPEDCDILLILGCLTRTQVKPLMNFWKSVPSTCKIISIGNCGSEKQDLFNLKEKNLTNQAIHLEELSQLLPIDEVIEGCPPDKERVIQALKA